MRLFRTLLIAAAATAVSVIVVIGLPESTFITQIQTTSAHRPAADGKVEIGSRSLHTHEKAWGLFGYLIVREQMCEEVFSDGSQLLMPWTQSRHVEAGPALVTVLFLGLIWLCAGASMRPGRSLSTLVS